MSDFLSNLAARSRETVEPIRPRVPSLFERDRRYDGRLRVRQETTETATPEEDGVGRPNDGDLTETMLVDRFPVSLERPVAPEAMRSSLPSTAASQPSSHIDLRKSALTPQSKSLPNLRQGLGNSTVQGEETSLGRADDGKSKHPLTETRPSVETANSVERNSNVSFGRFNPIGTETLSASTVRPTRRSRAEIESTPPTPVPADRSSESSVQVTIGRVEVRAIFPESSIRQTTPRHSKPAVSLDDYLKQRNR
jgi:hypothetical protein